MSSILNALKKIEAESAAAAKVQVRSGKLRLHPGTESRPHRFIVWSVMVFGALLLAAGAWLVLRHSKAPITPPVQSYRIASRPNRRPVAAQKRAETGRKPVATHPAGAPAPTRIQPQAPAGHTLKTPPAPAHKHPAARPAKPKNPPSRMHAAPQRPPARTEKVLSPQTVYKVSGQGLTLQAIAWDPTPQKRFAVVNSQIVHEGQSIDGKVIGQIQRDAIIVRRGSENWKIVFR